MSSTASARPARGGGKRTKGGKGAKAGKAGKGGIVTALLLLPAGAVLLPTCIVLLVGMMPTAVAAVVERSRSRHLAITVGLLNFCGTLPGLVTLWEDGQTFATAAWVATDALFWLTAFGAAAIGWGISLTMPLLVAAIYSGLSGRRLERLQRRQEHLVREWGEEVATDSEGDSP